ncbi:MAG: hypothetical protein IT293_12125 [Deltaproteobacteria bacterium]|nr:hypothetical protein [Deltaproteobacteria bacterium]
MSAARIVRRASTAAAGSVPAVLAWAATAAACPVCFAADERTRASFLATAVALSALPLALFAGLAFWFWRELDGHARRAPRLSRKDAGLPG